MNYGEIRIKATGVVMPEHQYRASIQDLSFAVDRAPPGTDRVIASDPPATTIYQRAVRSGVALVGEQWQYAWQILPALVPERIPMRNARRILYRDGLLAQVETIIAGMAGEQGDLARIDWATAQTVERTDPLVLYVIPDLGKSEIEIDHMFIDADALG